VATGGKGDAGGGVSPNEPAVVTEVAGIVGALKASVALSVKNMPNVPSVL
jgi:hypothetical protein